MNRGGPLADADHIINTGSLQVYTDGPRVYRRPSIRSTRGASYKHEPKSTGPITHQAGWFDRLNQHFATIGSTVADSLAASDTGETLHPRPPRVSSGAFTPRPATLPELSAALQRMGTSKASGADGITIGMIRTTFSVVGPHILHVVNSCITRCELPTSWRAASVVPLHKGGNVHDPSNYRPISILPVLSKLCERVVCSQLMAYLLSHNLLCSEQYGFRPGLSTEAALLDTVTYITDNIDGGRVTSLVTADTSKAFDSVEHGRLLEKLGWYGIDQRWFRAWLGGRTQSIRGGSGEKLTVSHGIIQGSILGPVLFLIFTNDMPQHVPYGRMVMYADDVQFLDCDITSNLQDLKERLQRNMQVALNWFTQNRLKVNPSKTEMMILKSRRLKSDSNISITFGNSELVPTQSAKILGVTLDSELAWDKHVATIVRRCYCVLIGLSRTRRRMPHQTRQLLVEALVFRPPYQILHICLGRMHCDAAKATAKVHKLRCPHSDGSGSPRSSDCVTQGAWMAQGGGADK